MLGYKSKPVNISDPGEPCNNFTVKVTPIMMMMMMVMMMIMTMMMMLTILLRSVKQEV